MPIYNCELYLDEAIQSVLTQTYTNFEFIIINDGSTDETLNIIKAYSNQDKRIVLINRKNKGLVYSLNEGIDMASGEYIARMDADDISLPGRFKQQVEYMISENLDICGGHYFLINEDGAINGLNLTPRTHDMCCLSMISKVPFAHPSVIIKKEFIDKHGLRYGQSKYKISEDFDLWIRLFNNGAIFGNVDDVVIKYRVVRNSLSKINHKAIRHDTKELLTGFIETNKIKIKLKQIINDKNKTNLNYEEDSLIIRAIYKLYLKRLNFTKSLMLKKFSKKNVVCTILSEIVN